MRESEARDPRWHEVARPSLSVQSSPRECIMSGVKREGWGSLRRLPSGRWQVRYSGPDGETYTARTDDDRPLTFVTKTDARTWLASLQTRVARGRWEPPEVTAATLRREVAARPARSRGCGEYAARGRKR